MQKSKEGKIFFEEFVYGISAFCLSNNEALLHFVFDLIDFDGDERISIKDIINLVEYKDPQTSYRHGTEFKVTHKKQETLHRKTWK